MKKTLGLVLLSCPAFAAPSSSLDIATTLGSLLFVLGFILFLAWLLKRMKVPVFGQQKGFQIIRQLPVGTKERIMIVQAGEEQFLIGVTSHSIQLIAKLDSPLTQEAQEATPFANQLTQLLKKHEK
ncbi:flagellar biosynthetic protein FliO [Vibrio sp. 11986-1-5]|uniref:flagellar biosynthetic protein FliO n=1 Tax=Vibrio sp. 11986-1-5 TaxID=2211215 RepID=UPI000D73859C|nr:flagellar biosynthetic protein FliO [Vibrio sp. 11986-1-5]PXA74594.1 flagellar biosynthetic protein FliO [Vibrio sp. 11986-1-5]